MNRSLYGKRDYAFGQLILTLRTHIGLTQAGLADVLEISRRAVAQWEAGSSYPKAHYLRQVITLGMRASAFAAGREEEEIRALWKAAHQKVLLDEAWLQELLKRPAPSLAGFAGEQTSGARPGSAALYEECVLWTVPYARNLHFTGRDELFHRLEQQLLPQEPDPSTALRRAALTQAQAIKGLGGIGKTQIAVEYAYRAREQGRYTHTLWITAASLEAILTSFATLADLLPDVRSKGEVDQRKLVAAVIGWLEQREQPWLLIFDNADDLSLVHPYLPVRGNGSILLTSRASAVGSLAWPIEVETMGIMEGTQLLLRRAHRFADASEEEINEASNLVVVLAQFPLALDQAGAYLEETGCSVSDYLQLYQTHRLALLTRRGKQATGYPESVATTWSLSFQQVEQATPAAAELLQLCAFLSPDHIPEELLTGGSSYWPLALQQAVADHFSFNQVLETLLAFSLVKRLAEDHLLSIHRLVQVVQMEQLSLKEQQQWAKRVVLALHSIFPHPQREDSSTWPLCLRYLEQAQACDLLIQHYQLVFVEAADLLDRTGVYLQERTLYSQAEPLLHRALHLYEQHLGLDHLSVALSLQHLTLLYLDQGKYALPESLSLRALHIREQHLGPEHHEVADALQTLAFLYMHQGKHAQAEPLYERALHIYEEQLGPEHPRVAIALNNLALLYLDEGKHAQVEPLYERALHIKEEQFGPEHPQVAMTLHGLALLFAQQGRQKQAEAFFQRAFHIQEQMLESKHPETAALLHDFADFQQAWGHTSEAVRMYQRALTIREHVFGAAHPLTTETREHLHAVLQMPGGMEKQEVSQ
ncbi:MAG: tetratricopeptide repeat protein [Ktedonobacteraceae bacterium]